MNLDFSDQVPSEGAFSGTGRTHHGKDPCSKNCKFVTSSDGKYKQITNVNQGTTKLAQKRIKEELTLSKKFMSLWNELSAKVPIPPKGGNTLSKKIGQQRYGTLRRLLSKALARFQQKGPTDAALSDLNQALVKMLCAERHDGGASINVVKSQTGQPFWICAPAKQKTIEIRRNFLMLQKKMTPAEAAQKVPLRTENELQVDNQKAALKQLGSGKMKVKTAAKTKGKRKLECSDVMKELDKSEIIAKIFKKQKVTDAEKQKARDLFCKAVKDTKELPAKANQKLLMLAQQLKKKSALTKPTFPTKPTLPPAPTKPLPALPAFIPPSKPLPPTPAAPHIQSASNIFQKARGIAASAVPVAQRLLHIVSIFMEDKVITNPRSATLDDAEDLIRRMEAIDLADPNIASTKDFQNVATALLAVVAAKDKRVALGLSVGAKFVDVNAAIDYLQRFVPEIPAKFPAVRAEVIRVMAELRAKHKQLGGTTLNTAMPIYSSSTASSSESDVPPLIFGLRAITSGSESESDAPRKLTIEELPDAPEDEPSDEPGGGTVEVLPDDLSLTLAPSAVSSEPFLRVVDAAVNNEDTIITFSEEEDKNIKNLLDSLNAIAPENLPKLPPLSAEAESKIRIVLNTIQGKYSLDDVQAIWPDFYDDAIALLIASKKKELDISTRPAQSSTDPRVKEIDNELQALELLQYISSNKGKEKADDAIKQMIERQDPEVIRRQIAELEASKELSIAQQILLEELQTIDVPTDVPSFSDVVSSSRDLDEIVGNHTRHFNNIDQDINVPWSMRSTQWYRNNPTYSFPNSDEGRSEANRLYAMLTGNALLPEQSLEVVTERWTGVKLIDFVVDTRVAAQTTFAQPPPGTQTTVEVLGQQLSSGLPPVPENPAQMLSVIRDTNSRLNDVFRSVEALSDLPLRFRNINEYMMNLANRTMPLRPIEKIYVFYESMVVIRNALHENDDRWEAYLISSFLNLVTAEKMLEIANATEQNAIEINKRAQATAEEIIRRGNSTVIP